MRPVFVSLSPIVPAVQFRGSGPVELSLLQAIRMAPTAKSVSGILMRTSVWGSGGRLLQAREGHAMLALILSLLVLIRRLRLLVALEEQHLRDALVRVDL